MNKNLKKKNLATLIALVLFILLVYGIAIVRMKGH